MHLQTINEEVVILRKKVLSLILSFVLILSLVPTSFAADASLKVDNTTANAGESVTLTYVVPNKVDDVASASIKISFDKSKFEVLSVTTATIANAQVMYSTDAEANNTGELTATYTEQNGDAFGTIAANTALLTAVLKVKDDATGDVTFTVVDASISDVGGESLNDAAGINDLPATVTIPGAHTHVFDQKNTNAKYLASAASCTAKATYYYSCTCGEKGTATFESGETLPHTASTVWSKDATHHWHVCQTCNAELDKAAHNPGPAATETTPQTCTICGYEIAPVLPHTHDYVEVVDGKYLKTAAGCENDAVYYKSCSKCHEAGTETFTVADTALGHSYTAEKVADQYLKDAAGCETDAVYFKSCARCGAKGTETFTVANSALGHVQASPWAHNDTEHWQVCTRCSKDFRKAAHNGGTATCQAKAACTTCGAAYGELGAHDMDTKWSSNDTQHFHKCLTKGCDYIKDAADHSGGKATCKEKAKCDVCAAEYGNLGAHTLTKTAAKAPTCLEPGNNEYYTCSVCGKVFKDAAGTTETTVAAETLAKSTTHVVESKYATSATEHWQICKVCGTVVGKAAHKFGEADTNGRKTCADCGYTVGGTGTEGHKHAAGNTICYDENNHWNKCTDDNCDAHVNESAHKFGPKNTVTEGNKTITIETCSECGYVKRTETTTGGTTPVNPGGNKPTKPGTKDNGKTVQSGKTFDAGVGVYVGLSILSLTGSAVVIGKKRKTR